MGNKEILVKAVFLKTTVLVMQDEYSGDIMVNVVSIVSNTVTIT